MPTAEHSSFCPCSRQRSGCPGPRLPCPLPPMCAASPCPRRGGTGGCHSRAGKVTQGRSCRGSFRAHRVTSRSRPVCPGRGGTGTAPTAGAGRGDEGETKEATGPPRLRVGSWPPARASSPGANRSQPSDPVPGAPRLQGAEPLGNRTLVPAASPGRAVGSAMTLPAPRSPHQIVPELLAAHIVHGLAAQRRRHGVSAVVG